jgi:acid phosphatase
MRQIILLALLASSCVSTEPPRGEAPTPNPGRRETLLGASDLVVIGDQGTATSVQYAVAAAIVKFCKSHTCDHGLGVGDNFYPAGVTSERDTAWQTRFEEPYKNIPFTFFPIYGNHDYMGDWQALLIHDTARWHMPARYYRLTTLYADIFAIDTEHFDRAQFDWLKAGLADAKKPWQIVYGHRPMYSSGSHGDTKELHGLLLPLLEKYAEFYLSGHDHDLEHIVKNGVNYLVSGSAGKTSKVGKGKNTLFSAGIAGFLFLDFEPRSVELSFVDSSAKVVYSRKITQKGS